VAQKTGKPQNVFNFDYSRDVDGRPPQSYYDDIKARFAEERDLRLSYRPPGTQIYTSEFVGDFARYEEDPYATERVERPPVRDEVEVLFIGGGFSALLTSARLRQKGVESIRIVERGADVGGTWYWNRYPGVACDVVSYDYLPLLDETGYVQPTVQQLWDARGEGTAYHHNHQRAWKVASDGVVTFGLGDLL